MKKLLSIAILSLSMCYANAQSKHAENDAVEKTILNYIENFFENNYSAMSKSLHPRLAKRGFNPNGTLSHDFTPEKLRVLMLSKPKYKVAHQNNTVEKISIYGNMASASLKTGYPKTRWVEFIHLMKQDGKWRIINVFWEFKKAKKP